MSTKRLSRTVIEGGRRNVWERRASTQDERAEVRDYLNRCESDPDFYDEEAEPERRVVYKEFSDKLNPMERWLAKQVGRVWADVRSEVFERFDVRTTAGRHITFDHLLREVVDTESGFDKYGRMTNPNVEVIASKRNSYVRYYGYNDYYVDENGILCENPNRGKTRRSWREPYASLEECAEVSKWLNYRIIGEKDGKLCWFAPTQGIWKAEWIKDGDYGYGTKLRYYLRERGEYTVRHKVVHSYGSFIENLKKSGDHWVEVEVPFSFRQSAALNSNELKYFNGLKARLKRDILSYGKGR